MTYFFEISELLPPVVLSVRNELDMEISTEDYLDTFNKNIENIRIVSDTFLEKVAR